MIQLKTVIGFLFFQSAAIRMIARSRQATWLGMLFVLSAGFAREYDGEYLVAEPWHLLLPLLASLLGCAAMTLLVWFAARLRCNRNASLLRTFRSLLNVYWMTAPMAWLYAIPVERFLSPYDATRANLVLLGVVSVWRVTLMIRCVSVLYRARPTAAAMPVMLFSDVMAILALHYVPAPIFMIMGGIRLTESESMILSVRMLLGAAVFFTAPVWFIGYIVVCREKQPWQCRLLSSDSPPINVSMRSWAVAIASLLVWMPILRATQDEQKLRYAAEGMLRSGQLQQLVELVRKNPQGDFPPHWDPPPRVGYGEVEPSLVPTASVLKYLDTPDWFMQQYEEKLLSLEHRQVAPDGHESLSHFSDTELAEFVELIRKLSNGKSIASRLKNAAEHDLSQQNQEPPIGESRKQLLREITETAGEDLGWGEARLPERIKSEPED